MYKSVHAFGIDKIPGLRETPYLGSVNNNYVWIISLFKLINDTTNEYKYVVKFNFTLFFML